MQSIDSTALLDFDRELDRILANMPDERKRLHEEIGNIIKEDLDSAISSSGLTDLHGNVRRWQVKHTGTGGGYAAVRPAGSKDNQETGHQGREYPRALPKTGPNSPGAITNYLTRGHKIRSIKSGKKYRKRVRMAKVPGYHFYDAAHASTEAKVIGKVEEYVNRLSARIEGSS